VDEADDATSAAKITSLKKLMEEKKNRGGYTDDQIERGILFKQTSLKEWLLCADPYPLLGSCHKVGL
jgi:hypothetical protein